MIIMKLWKPTHCTHLSNTASFVLCVLRRVKDPRHLLDKSSRLKKACVGQVVLAIGIYVYIYIYTHVCLCVYIYIYTCIHTYVYITIYVRIHMIIYIYVYVYR